MKFLALAAMLLLASEISMAESPVEDQPLKVTGYFDSYYQYSPQGHMAQSGAGAPYLEGRVFDNLHNQVVLNMVELSVSKKLNEIYFRLDLGFGQQIDAMVTNGTIGATTGQPTGADIEPTRHVSQAYLSYTPSEHPNLTVTAGKFYAFIGLEGFKAKDNWQYSRSFNYNFNPYWHQGISAKYAILPERISVALYFLNASDGRLSQETNRSPSMGVSVSATAVDGWTTNYNYLGGPESHLPNSRREVHEINSSFQIASEWSVAVDYAYARQKNVLASGEDGHWWVIDGYVKYQPVKWYYLSPRYEYVDDTDQGVGLSAFGNTGGVKQRIQGVTITNAFQMKNGLELRAEYRSDRSNRDGYFRSAKGGLTKTQDSLTVAALFAF